MRVLVVKIDVKLRWGIFVKKFQGETIAQMRASTNRSIYVESVLHAREAYVYCGDMRSDHLRIDGKARSSKD